MRYPICPSPKVLALRGHNRMVTQRKPWMDSPTLYRISPPSIEGSQPNQVVHGFTNALPHLPTSSGIGGQQPNENVAQLGHGFTTPEHMSGVRDPGVPSPASQDLGLLGFDNSSHNYDATFGGDESLYFHNYGATSANLSSVSNSPSIGHASHFTSETQQFNTSVQTINPISHCANPNNNALSTSIAPSVHHTTVCDANPVASDVNIFGNASPAAPNASSSVHYPDLTAFTTNNLIQTPANVNANNPITTSADASGNSNTYPGLTAVQSIDPAFLLTTNVANTFEPPVVNPPTPATILQCAGIALRRSGRPVVPTEKVAHLNKPNSKAGKENKAGSDQNGTVKRVGRGGTGTRPSKRARIEG
jgi:hypothetical protein